MRERVGSVAARRVVERRRRHRRPLTGRRQERRGDAVGSRERRTRVGGKLRHGVSRAERRRVCACAVRHRRRVRQSCVRLRTVHVGIGVEVQRHVKPAFDTEACRCVLDWVGRGSHVRVCSVDMRRELLKRKLNGGVPLLHRAEVWVRQCRIHQLLGRRNVRKCHRVAPGVTILIGEIARRGKTRQISGISTTKRRR